MLDKVCPRSYVNRDKAATKNTWANLKEHLHWQILLHWQQAKMLATMKHLRLFGRIWQQTGLKCCILLTPKETRQVKDLITFIAVFVTALAYVV
jgi:hypothetical protein